MEYPALKLKGDAIIPSTSAQKLHQDGLQAHHETNLEQMIADLAQKLYQDAKPGMQLIYPNGVFGDITINVKLECDRIAAARVKNESEDQRKQQVMPQQNGAQSNEISPPTPRAAVLLKSDSVLEDSETVEELDFNRFAGRSITVDDLMESMANMGFQAISIGEAVRIINDMRSWRDPENKDKTTIFLGYTESNFIWPTWHFRWLAEHNHVSAIVTTAGGIEEDFIKCLANTYVGSFSTPGKELRDKGINRIGNLIAPNDNYCKFEDWVVLILDKMLEEQEASKEQR